jgi:DNA-binding MarR family transcriptional regulator
MDKAADGSVPYRGKVVKPLTDKEQAAWRALMRLLIVLPRVIEADMIRAGQLTISQYTVLMHLSEAEDRSMRMNALAELTRLTESGMSRIVAHLSGEGLVERRRSSQDGRGQVVALTETGLAQLEATFPGHLASVRHHVFDALTGVDLDSFTDALSRIAPDEPLAHLSNVEIPSRQRAAAEPNGARRPRHPGRLRSVVGWSR